MFNMLNAKSARACAVRFICACLLYVVYRKCCDKVLPGVKECVVTAQASLFSSVYSRNGTIYKSESIHTHHYKYVIKQRTVLVVIFS